MHTPTTAPIVIPALAPTERPLSVVEAAYGPLVLDDEEEDVTPVCRPFPAEDVGDVGLAGEFEEILFEALVGEAPVGGLFGVLLLDVAACDVAVAFGSEGEFDCVTTLVLVTTAIEVRTGVCDAEADD